MRRWAGRISAFPVVVRHMKHELARRAANVRAAAAAVASVVGLIVIIAGVLFWAGYDVPTAFSAFVRGSFGSVESFTSATLVRATPLIFTGLAVAVAFRGGVLNVGADGQLLGGAAAATAVALAVDSSVGAIGIAGVMVAGAIGGIVCAAIPAWMRRRFGVLEVITTIMMNFLVLYFVGYLVRGPLQEPMRIYPQSASIAPSLVLPRLWSGSRLHLGFVFAVLLSLGVWWVFRYSAAGFRVRAIGANPSAAATAGRINVPRVGLRVFLASGCLAGLAGAVEVTGVTHALYENLSPGYGFTAIAVALLAGLHPLVLIASAILFGAISAGASAMQRDAGVPAVLVSVLEGGVILGVLLARALSRGGESRRG